MGVSFNLEDLLEEPTSPVGSSALTPSRPGFLGGKRLFGFGEAPGPNGTKIVRHGEGYQVPVGTGISPVDTGTVDLASDLGTYRGTVIVNHGSHRTLYSNLDSIMVKPGDKVGPDSQLGLSGGAQSDEGPHVEFQVRDSTGVAIDPSKWMGSRQAVQNVAPPPPQAPQPTSYDIEDLLGPEPKAPVRPSPTYAGRNFPDLPEFSGARALARHQQGEMIPPEEIARQEKLAMMSTRERAVEFGKGMAEGAAGLVTFPADALKPILEASPQEEQNPLVRSFAAAKAGGPTKAPALPMPGTAAPTEGLDLAGQFLTGLNPEPLARQIVHGALNRDPHDLGLAAGFEAGGKALGLVKELAGGAMERAQVRGEEAVGDDYARAVAPMSERGDLPQPTLPPQVKVESGNEVATTGKEPQTFELDDLLEQGPVEGHPEPPAGLTEKLLSLGLDKENVVKIVTGRSVQRAEEAPAEGRRVESQGPPEGMPERRMGTRRAEAAMAEPEKVVGPTAKNIRTGEVLTGAPGTIHAELPIQDNPHEWDLGFSTTRQPHVDRETARAIAFPKNPKGALAMEQIISPTETLRKLRAKDEAGFEDFAREYRQHFADMQKYGPDQVGSQVFAEKMAKMEEAHPDWAERVENEGAPEKPAVEVSTGMPGGPKSIDDVLAMEPDEVQRTAEALKQHETGASAEVFGAEQGKAYEKAQRIINSSTADPYSQRYKDASQLIDDLESKLTPAQQQRLFGYGETGPSHEDIAELAGKVDRFRPEVLAGEETKDLVASFTHLAGGERPTTDVYARYGLPRIYKEAVGRGVTDAQLISATLERMKQRGISEGTAGEALAARMNDWRKMAGPVAASKAPIITTPQLGPAPLALEQPKLEVAEPFTSHEIGKTLSILNETDYGLLQRRDDVRRQLDKIPEDKRDHPTAQSLADDLDVLNEEVKVRGGLQGAAEELAANQNAEGQPIKAPEPPLLADETATLEQPKVVGSPANQRIADAEVALAQFHDRHAEGKWSRAISAEHERLVGDVQNAKEAAKATSKGGRSRKPPNVVYHGTTGEAFEAPTTRGGLAFFAEDPTRHAESFTRGLGPTDDRFRTESGDQYAKGSRVYPARIEVKNTLDIGEVGKKRDLPKAFRDALKDEILQNSTNMIQRHWAENWLKFADSDLGTVLIHNRGDSNFLQIVNRALKRSGYDSMTFVDGEVGGTGITSRGGRLGRAWAVVDDAQIKPTWSGKEAPALPVASGKLEQPKLSAPKGEPYKVWTPKSGYTEMPGAKPAKLALPPGFEDMQFMVHKAVGQPGWSVTEASTGANVGLGKTRAAAIETATKALTTVGPEKTLKAIEQTTAKIKAGEAARTGEPVSEPTPADPIEAMRQHAQAIAVTEKAIEHGKGANGEPFTPEQLDGFKKDAADQRAQLEQKIEQHAEVHGLKEAEKLRGQIWNEIKNTEIETPKPPTVSVNPKFQKLDNEALVARQFELENRIQKDQQILNRGVQEWAREDPNLEPGLQGSVKSGKSWSRSAMYAQGRINQSGRLLDEISKEVADRKIDPEQINTMREAAEERAAMVAEEEAKGQAATFEEHRRSGGPEAGFILAGLLDPRFLAEKTGVTGFLKKYFTSKGNLPEAAFEENRQRIADIGAQDAQIGYTIRDFHRAAKEAYAGRKPTKAELQDLDDALKGQVPPSAVHPALQPVIASMRRQIDRLSEELINIGAVEGKVAAAITDNLGVYATRAYRVFEDPKWAEKVPDSIKNKVKALLRSEYPGAPPEEIDGLLDELIYRGEDSPLSLIARGSTLGSKDLSILQRRKDIAPEIRALWGEYHDPLVSYARSMTKMGHLIANHQFLTEVRNQGLGDFFHEKPIVKGGQSYHTKFASEGSKVLEPLNGLYTTPEIAQAFRDAFDPKNTSALMRGYMAVNGAVKYGKTVLSPLTHVRNVLGNVGFAVTNGHWRIHKGVNAALATLADLGIGDTPARRAYLDKMRRLGVIDESARGGELEAVIKDVTRPGASFEESLIGRVVRSAGRVATKLYQAEDNVWKLYAWENERARYARALPNATPEFLDRKAADIVRNTYPTFSLVPKAIKTLRRFPLVGSFVSFSAEVFRTGYRTLKLAQEELSNPETHAIGAQRLAGITLAAVGVTGLTLGVREMQGWTKDREEALRRFMPPWSENSPLLILGSDGSKVRLIDLGYSDPYSPLRKPVLAMLRGKDWKGSLARMIVEGAAPFLSEEILAGALLDVSRNKTKTGGRVYNPEDDPSDQAAAIADHVWRAVEPGGVSSARRIYKGIAGTAGEQGRLYDPTAEMAAVATGQRIMHLDVEQAARYKLRQRMAELRDTELRVTSLLAKSGTGKAETIGAEYRQMNTHRQNVWHELQEDVHAAGMFGLSDRQLAQLLVTSGFSQEATVEILKGQYRPYLPSQGFLQDVLSKAVQSGTYPDNAAAGTEFRNRLQAIVKAAREVAPKR